MASTWTDYWRVVTPSSPKKEYTQLAQDSIASPANSPYPSMMNYAWYTQVIKGATSRMQRYMQYDSMDADTDISRALDTIAEEMATPDTRTDLPFIIAYQNEESEAVSETVVTTLRAAVRHWATVQDLNNRIFRIARHCIKYGDCFFKKVSDFKKWEFIDPKVMIGIEVNEKMDAIAYHTRKQSLQNAATGKSEFNIIPAGGVIHFTLSDDMGESAPFGDSILQPVYRVFRQMLMLEDSIIIYRIVRAPERRVFYIDVGNMPAQRVKQYLEQVKNDIRQKRIPGQSGDFTDSTYNPMCLAMDTKISLLDGRSETLQTLIDEYQTGKINWTYSCDPVTGAIIPGKITWAGVTRKNTTVIKLTLDDGSVITCTPDHKFPVIGKGPIQAQHLTADDSLIPFNKRYSSIDETLISEDFSPELYEQVYDISTKQWISTHKMVADNSELKEIIHKIKGPMTTIHHADFNKHNNSPTNLVWMNNRDHFSYHADHNTDRFNSWTEEKQQDQISSLNAGLDKMWKSGDWSKLITMQERRNAGIKAAHEEKGHNEWFYGENSSALSEVQRIKITAEMKARMRELMKETAGMIKRLDFIELMQKDDKFLTLFKKNNNAGASGRRSKPTYVLLENFLKEEGYKSFVHFKAEAALSNHKITKIEWLEEKQDTGCITVTDKEKYHTFALANGVFTNNSSSEDYFFPVTGTGRGSRIETLPGGDNLGENTDLVYFQKKVFRGLRVPSSYMSGQDAQGAQFNDGKVGIAYIEELRFANFVKRLQTKIEQVFDQEFKAYLRSSGIKVDEELFQLRLPDPQNFALYRQAALDGDLINTFNSADGIKYLSKKFILKRYLGLTEDEIQMNETLIKQERGIIDIEGRPGEQQIYDPAIFENREAIKIEEPKPEKEEAPEDLEVPAEGEAEAPPAEEPELPEEPGSEENAAPEPPAEEPA